MYFWNVYLSVWQDFKVVVVQNSLAIPSNYFAPEFITVKVKWKSLKKQLTYLTEKSSPNSLTWTWWVFFLVLCSSAFQIILIL